MRHITFIIPGEPAVQVEAIEQPDGTIIFNLTVISDGNMTGDLRGLFFDLTEQGLEDNLVMDGGDITNQDYGNVSNLGNGVNMNGNGAAPYDAGVAFGLSGIGRGRSDISATSFVLSTLDGSPLTLDIITHMDFGARVTSIGEHTGSRSGSSRITTIAPGAPDAIDDTGLIAVEDTTIIFDVLANDTDADGDMLTITDVTAPQHGTVEIINNMLVYTPDENYGGGPDTFEYTLSDNNGGGDTATVSLFVEAVADAPALTVITSAGASVNEIVLTITSALVDTDGSETYELVIDTDMLPEGATLSRTHITNPGAVETIILTLAPDSSAFFDLAVNAISTEGSNLDQAVTTIETAINVAFTENDFHLEFQATGQSQWDTGEDFQFIDDRFIGLDVDDELSLFDDNLVVGVDFRLGLQSTFELNGGSIDATIPWDISLDTTYNVTTDTLLIAPNAVLAGGGGFTTSGPSASYVLDFIYEFMFGIELGPDGDFYEETFINEAGRENLIDYDSATSDPFEFSLGQLPLTLELLWPTLNVDSIETTPGVYTGSDASNNFLELILDVDDLVFSFLGIPNPFDFEVGLDASPAFEFNAAFELFDFDLIGGLNFLQNFVMTAGDLLANLVFEDGSMQSFNLDEDLVINNASILDVDGDGEIEFDIFFSLDDTIVQNDTDLNINVGYEGGFISGSLFIEVLEIDIIDESTDGFLVPFGDSLDVGAVPIYDSEFELIFETETVEFSVVSPYSIDLTENADRFIGTDFDESVNGLGGDDILEGSAGADVLDGGDGIDTAVYSGATNRVNVNLLSGNGSINQAEGDTYVSIENVVGSNFGDTLRGDFGDNVLTGNGGKDVLIGFNGDDELLGGAGRDILNGGNGADVLDGGSGIDQARYNGSSEAVQINLLDGTASGGQAEGDVLLNIENLFGSNHGDVLYGDDANNQILGHIGDDFLAGNGGINKLFGGAGADSFVLSDGFSFVMDFEDDIDRLDVTDYGFSSLAEALENLDQVGNHARFRVGDDTLLVLNTDMNDLMNDIIFQSAPAGNEKSDFGGDYVKSVELLFANQIGGQSFATNLEDDIESLELSPYGFSPSEGAVVTGVLLQGSSFGELDMMSSSNEGFDDMVDDLMAGDVFA